MTSPSALELDTLYHIFNRGNNRENIFIDELTFRFFMILFQKYIFPVAETYAYCLLRNHFHLLVRIKSEDEILKSLGVSSMQKHRLRKTPSRHFSNFFNAYAKSINRTYHRTGSLFQHPFHRVPVTDENHIRVLISYIHRNPQHHGFVPDFRDWPFSSYHVHLSKTSPSRDRAVVSKFFRDDDRYIKFHSRELPLRIWEPLELEDFA
jgi:putative transposase